MGVVASSAATTRVRSRWAGLRLRRRVLPSVIVTAVTVVVVAGFLSPLVRSLTVSFKSPDQLAQVDSPIWPADPQTFEYQGKSYEVFSVPMPDGTSKDLALVTKGRTESKFVDPANAAAGLVTWQGSWRTLQNAWTFAPKPTNFSDAWDQLNFPRLFFNTAAIAIITTIGTILSCTLVAYGFARFRFPGRGKLFTLLIATIFLPFAVTVIPTYTIFVKLGWVGTWLPLLVPTFFANAYDVFLLRQYFLTIPREMDEAAAIDGAGPFRTLISVVLPQAVPALIAVAIFHFVYAWNDFFGPLIYLSANQDLQTLSVALARFNGIHSNRDPGIIQAGTLMTMVLPVVMFFIFQRVFVRGVVITGVER
ncbi:MAG: carbohydrate ABC transporter permease [Chloroflexi bacterium]|nr:MAG: carbohydrate ABC transporter permease [Chloroflexota bacterium]